MGDRAKTHRHSSIHLMSTPGSSAQRVYCAASAHHLMFASTLVNPWRTRDIGLVSRRCLAGRTLLWPSGPKKPVELDRQPARCAVAVTCPDPYEEFDMLDPAICFRKPLWTLLFGTPEWGGGGRRVISLFVFGPFHHCAHCTDFGPRTYVLQFYFEQEDDNKHVHLDSRKGRFSWWPNASLVIYFVMHRERTLYSQTTEYPQ